jgi:8-oxo-dGTP diphosphatase
MMDGKLIQTDKKYSHLKLKQKDKIAEWMYQETRAFYEKNYVFPDDKHLEEVVLKVYDSYTGTTFPGGHVEKDEIFQESIIREIREETGLEIKNPQLGGVYHWTKSGVHNVLFLYKANEYSGSLKSSEEGQVYWVPLEEFKQKELAGGMEYVLQILESPQVNECYMHLENGKYVGTLY